jgi:hypothetical protein
VSDDSIPAHRQGDYNPQEVINVGKMAKKVTIELDKSRTLLLNMNSMIEFENATGQDFLEFTKRIQRRGIAFANQKAIAEGKQGVPAPIEEDLNLPDLNMKEMRAMLWCLLIHEDENLTLKQVGALITSDNMQEVFEAMIKAQSANSPEPGKTEGEASVPLEAAPQA